MKNTKHLPTASIAEVKQTIFQYTLMFYPCRQAIAEFERRENQAVLDALAASTNAETNQVALSIVNAGKVPDSCDLKHAVGIMVRLLHNLERLEEFEDHKRLILAYLDENGVLTPCKDVISYILLHAHCEIRHPFFFAADLE